MAYRASLHLTDVSLAHPSHGPPAPVNTWEPFVSFGGRTVEEVAGTRPRRSARTLAMRHRITQDVGLYERAVRLMIGLPDDGLDEACELGMRLHTMAQAERLECAGVDFVDIAADLLGD